jgi:hypothetical protein
MNIQAKVIETAADFRARAASLAELALSTARDSAGEAAKRVEVLKGSLSALQVAGREFNRVARRHAVRFVKENAVLARDVSKDVSTLARTTYSRLVEQDVAPARKARKVAKRRPGARTRAAAKAT